MRVEPLLTDETIRFATANDEELRMKLEYTSEEIFDVKVPIMQMFLYIQVSLLY